MKRIGAKLTYSNVVSTICLFLLLGGGAAWAATQLPKNSVGAKQLKDGSVTASKLAPSARTALTGPRGATGATGAQGARGADGAAGAAGKDGSPGRSPVSTVAAGGNALEAETFARTTFTVAEASEVLVHGDVGLEAVCEPLMISETCSYEAELRVDGNQLGGSYQFGLNTSGGGGFKEFESFSGTADVGPGTHTVEIHYTLFVPVGTTASSVTGVNPSVTAVATPK